MSRLNHKTYYLIVPQHGIKKVYELDSKTYPGIEKWLMKEYAPTEESILRALAAYDLATFYEERPNTSVEIFFTGGGYAGKQDGYKFGAEYLAGKEVQEIWKELRERDLPKNITKIRALPGKNLYEQVKGFLHEINYAIAEGNVIGITSEYHLFKLAAYLAEGYREVFDPANIYAILYKENDKNNSFVQLSTKDSNRFIYLKVVSVEHLLHQDKKLQPLLKKVKKENKKQWRYWYNNIASYLPFILKLNYVYDKIKSS